MGEDDASHGIRVIRTEFYFDRDKIAARDDGISIPAFPGVSVAWFRKPDAEWSIDTHLQYDGSLVEVRTFLDAALYDVHPLAVPAVYNNEIVEFLLTQDIIIEHSPPEAVSLLTVLAHGTNISIGSYLGYAVSRGDIPLMFITIPAGVIVMGAAMGVSNGLKNSRRGRAVGPRCALTRAAYSVPT
jgi:hypothetical protein